ncbi:hypothetical protein JB92DRAFT_3028774 [Gautieria morchelliformis]|nr:hypothetical protein JB92DRAFT_3028774 [Gautieria morchelliformis]
MRRMSSSTLGQVAVPRGKGGWCRDHGWEGRGPELGLSPRSLGLLRRVSDYDDGATASQVSPHPIGRPLLCTRHSLRVHPVPSPFINHLSYPRHDPAVAPVLAKYKSPHPPQKVSVAKQPEIGMQVFAIDRPYILNEFLIVGDHSRVLSSESRNLRIIHWTTQGIADEDGHRPNGLGRWVCHFCLTMCHAVLTAFLRTSSRHVRCYALGMRQNVLC